MDIVKQMQGVIEPVQIISGELKKEVHIEGVLSVGGLAVTDDVPQYVGDYVITPNTTEDITLETAKKLLVNDLVVEKIPYAEVTNNSNGKTITIG